jgi:predicted AlkP superfamily pyrophosphatase or phosphodiesterase
VILLSVPALRECDLAHMPRLARLMAGGERAGLIPSFPAVTWPVQANMTTGCLPREHGVVANGFYWRERHEVEMWTAWNDVVTRPQIWDRLQEIDTSIKSAAWFPLLSKGSGANYICTPAPIHNPDGTESMWCYSRPEELYQELLDELGHFPLHRFWGPLASIEATAWIFSAAVRAARRFQPNFFYIYVPHLDYAAQKFGPNSEPAEQALAALDDEIEKLVMGFTAAYQRASLTWLVASEYAIVPVDHVAYPNRVLRAAGLLKTRAGEDGQHLDLLASDAWALVDHQFSHVFVRDRQPAVIRRVGDLFRGQPGIAEVLSGEGLTRYALDHERSGDVVLVSAPNSWQAYYWWTDDAEAPGFARTVDIHRKPGYDPVEMFLDPATRSTPLDATLMKGSHGAPAVGVEQRGVLLTSSTGIIGKPHCMDTDVAQMVLQRFVK